MTDNWDQEEGYISQGMILGFCELSTTVVAGEPVAILTTGAANKVMVKKWASQADSRGVALKGGNTGDRIPVCFYGVCKMAAYSTITGGDIVMNAGTAGTVGPTYGNVVPIPPSGATFTYINAFKGLSETGTIIRLGMALQAATTTGDELLVLIGGLY